MMDLIVKFSWDESGAPAVEYALLLGFMVVALVVALKSFGAAVHGLFERGNAQWPVNG